MLQAWHIWIIVALVCLIIEIFTSGFAIACLSIGGVFAAVAALLGIDLIWQILVFAVFSALAFAFLRPIILKAFFKKTDEKYTNADALIGKKGKVSVDIDPEKGSGRVAIDGDDWKAVSEDGSFIEKGTFVQVTALDSIIITVKKI